MERQIIQSMKNKDFATAIYYDNKIKEMLRNDKNINDDFKKLV